MLTIRWFLCGDEILSLLAHARRLATERGPETRLVLHRQYPTHLDD